MGVLAVTCLRAGHGQAVVLLYRKNTACLSEVRIECTACKTGNLPREPLSSARAVGTVVSSHQAKSVTSEQLSSWFRLRRSEKADL